MIGGGEPTPLPPIRVPSPPLVTAAVPATTPPTATATAPPPAPTSTPEVTATITATPLPTSTPSPRPSPAAGPPDQVLPAISSLVVMPDQPNVMYAVMDTRIYRSTNEGYRWVAADPTGLPAGILCYALAVDSSRPPTLYLATSQGIYHKQEKGVWSRLSALRAGALAVDPRNASVLWAGVGGNILRSADAGRSWARADAGLESWSAVAAGARRVWVSDIVIHPNNPALVWAVVRIEGAESPPLGLLYRRDSNGRWERVNLQQFEPYAATNVDSCQVAGIAFDPVANILFAGCDRCAFNRGRLLVIRSRNAAAADARSVTWEAAAPIDNPTRPCYTAGAARPLAMGISTRHLLLSVSLVDCVGGGPLQHSLRATSDNGATWKNIRRGLP